MERGGVTEVRVTCAGKEDGQVTAAQAMLKVQWKRSPPTIVLSPPPSHQKRHPYITMGLSIEAVFSLTSSPAATHCTGI